MTFPFGPNLANLQNAIQQNFLERAFIEALHPILQYRMIADREDFPGRIGTSMTLTRVGLMIPNTTPLNPSTNTNIDNGLIPQQYSDEQYTLSIFQIPQVAPPINLMDDEVTIAAFLMKNAENLGIASAQSIDRTARAQLFNAYMSGNTVITASAGPVSTVSIDDTRGFQTVVVNGNVVSVSGSNPLPVFINNVLVNVTAFTNDVVNVSSALITGGTSGTITVSAPITVVAGQSVIGAFAPVIIRPSNRTTTAALTGTDIFNMQTMRNAVTYLRNNAVPTIDGRYNCYVNATSMNQLFADPEFQLLNRGTSTRDPVYESAWVMSDFLDMRFFQTTETYVQPPQGGAPVPVPQTIQRPIVCGKGALIEGIFTKGLDAVRNMSQGGVGEVSAIESFGNILGERSMTEGFYMYLRKPIDQLGQIVTQTTSYVGGFTVPTDVTTTTQQIPTASNAYYKRAVIIETA